MPDSMFPFQAALTRWACMKGRGAMFADCGMGKTLMQLVWAWNVHLKSGMPVLILTPLAVSAQTVGEAHKFGIEAARSTDGTITAPIIVTNYERLHHFNPEDFAGCVCDESSILKNFDGVRRDQITIFMRKMKYRLLTTATAAPNDYIELGTSSEALGYMGHMDMLGKFFKNDNNNSATGRQWGSISKWRFKGHAELAFWRWVCSWSRAVRKPSDMGFEDNDFILPTLTETEHVVSASTLADGMLFALPAIGLEEQREERSRTVEDRCEKAVSLVNHTRKPAILWCELNKEGDLMEHMLPHDCVQVSGDDSDEEKEEKIDSFIKGVVRVLVTKDKIAGLGLNFQHCAHMVGFADNSYERYYQRVRRCWRFGQKLPVQVDTVTTEGGLGVLRNLKRKAAQADEMFSQLVAQMNNAQAFQPKYNPTIELQLPSWILNK
jgi:hypothetical protein